MLHTETVEPHTLSVLKNLQAMPELGSFSLVGGTALALLYGHRISVDLDLFSHQPFTNDAVSKSLKMKFGTAFKMEERPPVFGIFCYIDEVKVDLVKHPHPLIRPLKEAEGIESASSATART
jgi:Nucleotidyl transferase AbiEii toxin, Type IV TA system